jgi:hypothetical protein
MAGTGQGDAERLVEFLQERDEPCPVCGYNLRDLTGQTCPECRQHLRLTVGVRDVRLAWFLVTIAPGIFSGIAAMLLLIPIIVSPLTGNGRAPWPVCAIDVFGFASGIVVLVLIARRRRFIRLRSEAQMGIALAAWGVHVIAFFLFLAGSI